VPGVPSLGLIKEQTVLVQTPPGGAAFAACLRLFRNFPLAVRRHYAEHRYGSMVLMKRGPSAARCYVLVMEWDDLFMLRHWDRRDGARLEIGRDTAVPGDVLAVLEDGVPVPRDGTLLGWVADGQVQAVLPAYGRLAEPWDDPCAVPGVLVMPRVGSQPSEWPALTVHPLDDRQLWEHVARGRLTELTPLVSRSAGRVYLVPDGRPGRPASALVVVTERISGDGVWLPAGVYADHWILREGTPVRTASQLLSLPGVVELSGGRGSAPLLGV
jgi:hypothetical protein